jgi:kynurenine formamidase
VSAQRWPDYDDLPRNDALGMNSAWGVFGEDDELGTIGLLTQERVLAAAGEVQRGRVFNLCLPLNQPPPRGRRSAYRHSIFNIDRNTQDDVVDNLYMQASTQWDALRHVRARELGFYNGVTAEDAAHPRGRLGIDRWAEHGMVGRGVLVDVVNHLEVHRQQTLSPSDGFAISPELIEEVLDAQGCQLRDGDFLLLRTGYIRAVLDPSDGERPTTWPGLAPWEPMARYLWNSHVAAVVADNPAVETAPGDPKEFLHRRLIPMLGLALGEFFNFEELAGDCREDGRYTCLFMAAPLNLPGGVGSPGNGIAVK